MKKDVNSNKILTKLVLKSSLLQIVSSLILISIFSLIMYFLELDKSLSVIFATLSIAISSFLTSLFASKEIGNKGYFTGFIVGIITFILITLVSFIVDKGAVSLNTLFHFIIILLSSMIGGILGVNKKPKKYI